VSLLGVLVGNGGNESSFASGDVLGVVWDLLGFLLNSHRRREPDSPVLDVLCDDAESTLNWRRKSNGKGAGGKGAEGADGLGSV
jgi:hypothetical protein